MATLKQISAAIFLAGLCSSLNAGAQSQSAETVKPAINTSIYNTAIGLRAGETSGLTFRHFVNKGRAFEGIVGIWPNAFGLTALYEKHARAFNMEGLNWYYGGGGHATFASQRTYYWYRYGDHYFYSYRADGSMALGFDGILGLEYKIKAIPFAISLDMKPFIDINASSGLYYSLDPGLGFKFVF